MASLNLAGKRAVVVGGTAGIGRGIAIRLAQANASVTVVGRSEQRGKEVIAEMQQAGSGTEHSFVPCDAMRIANVDACSTQIAKSHPAVDVLVLTQGMATIQGRTPTAEGLDEKLSLHYYSRVAFIEDLLPSLKRSDDARVMTVLSAGVHSVYAGYKDDPELERSYSLKNAADAAGLYNDLAMDALSRENPAVTFVHAAPGFVATSWGTEMPWMLRGLIRAVQVFGKSPAACAEALVGGLYAEERKGGFHLISEAGKEAAPTELHEEARDTVWANTRATLDRVRALGKTGDRQ